jgi:hypothetical protein
VGWSGGGGRGDGGAGGEGGVGVGDGERAAPAERRRRGELGGGVREVGVRCTCVRLSQSVDAASQPAAACVASGLGARAVER